MVGVVAGVGGMFVVDVVSVNMIRIKLTDLSNLPLWLYQKSRSDLLRTNLFIDRFHSRLFPLFWINDLFHGF